MRIARLSKKILKKEKKLEILAKSAKKVERRKKNSFKGKKILSCRN